MACNICSQPHDAQKLPFLCAVDARNNLYPGRLEYARTLIENEGLSAQIDILMSKADHLPARPTPAQKTVHFQHLQAEMLRSRERADRVYTQATKLQAEIDVARKEIEVRRGVVAQHKADMSAISGNTSTRPARQLEDSERVIQMTKYKWRRDAENMAATRGFLCMEAARLYGLRRTKARGSTVKYELGGVDIIELSTMSRASPDLISTSLAHISHMLALASHYLAIRLPAELTLPHKDYPRPTIFSLSSSYQHDSVRFPSGSLVFPSSAEDKHLPRPRPLFLDKSLTTLAKEDSTQYSQFVEGVTLLAYDIAWACCSQGVPIGDKNSYDDVCNIGRNLYNLMMGTQLINHPAARFVPDSPLGEATPNSDVAGSFGNSKTMMGRYSHGTAFDFLGSAEGNDFVRQFKLPSPIKLADRLKKKLLTEATNLDWDLLEDDPWPQESTAGKESVPSKSDPNVFGVKSIVSTRTSAFVSDERHKLSVAGAVSTVEKPKSNGTSGWTKVKSRV